MRLLKSVPGRDLTFTADLDEDDIPPYAILSHTWGAEEDEVTYKDFAEKTGLHKKGYNKLVLCEEQARRDGQSHFWVDTCCIDKSNSVELNTAITSMFHWYAKASKCYVYLSDVSFRPSQTDHDDDNNTTAWLSEFRSCRWLTRGWTLQELLAPKVVEFYDRTWKKLGDKSTLERHICDISGIPAAALRGHSLSSFGMEERFSWQRTRKTKKPEDEAYSLSGLFGVSMIPIYGEGRDKAMARLRKDVDDALQGPKRRDFSIPLSDPAIVGVETFVAREKELEEIHAALTSDGSRHTVALHGLGGIGKTQLAIAYAKRQKDNYSAILWFDIRDETSVKHSFGTIARRILRYYPSARYLSDINLGGNLDDVIEAVKAWLSESGNTRWLAIYDNYDNPKVPGNDDSASVDLHEFLPDAYQGSVIITTRFSQIRIGRAIPVRKLTSVQESVEILSNMSRRTLSADDPDVAALVQRLDGLPLALATTGSYLDQVSVSIAEYLKLHDSSWSQLHENDSGLDTHDYRPLYSTWRISLDRIQQHNELSAKLLGLWCYFSNQDLWYELLRDGPTEEIPWLRDLTANPPVFTEAMRLLCNYGLAESNAVSSDSGESGGYSVHACVHSWTVHVLNKSWNDELAEFAICAIGKHVPREDAREPWIIQRRLLQHAQRCLLYLPSTYSAQGQLKDSLHDLGRLFFNQSKMKEAEEMYLPALRGKQEALGAKHTSTLSTVNNLGTLYSIQERTKEAEEMFLQALRGREEVLGPKHKSTLETVNNLGILYSRQDRFEKSEEMYLRALRDKEEVLGPKHTSTLTTVHNLGILYLDEGKMKEAEEMCLRALKGREEVLGPKHTLTLGSLSALGLVYSDQHGRKKEAEQLYLQALQGLEEALGPKHTSTLSVVSSLALLYSSQPGRTKEAEELYLRALRGREETLGPKHATTLATVDKLGLLYSNQQGRMQEVEELYLRALRGFEETWGPKHTSTLETVNNLGLLYSKQGRMKEAEELYLRALQGREEALGPKHAATLETVDNLGLLYSKQGRTQEAKELYLRALRGYEEAEGDHEASIDSLQSRISDLRLRHVEKGDQHADPGRKRDRILHMIGRK